MAQQTEAACLLESGAMYPRRLLLHPESGDPIFAGFKNGAFSLYFGDAPFFHFDPEGRWQRALAEGVHYLKGLDSSVQAIDRVREGSNLVLKRRTLSYAEAVDFDALVRDCALDLTRRLDAGRLVPVLPPSKAQPLSIEELREILERITLWDAAAWFAHRERFLGAYDALPFLPPDCPNALILQPKSTGFERHALAVSALLGRRAEQSKVIYFAGSGVLRQPLEALSRQLEISTRVFEKEGVHVFLETFEAPQYNLADWEELRRLGLARVSLGVESGEFTVRQLYGKTWLDDELVKLVSNLKAAGIGVGLIMPVGAGGEKTPDHAAITAALISRLDLGSGDLISLLVADDLSHLGGSALAPGHSVQPLSETAYEPRIETLNALLAPIRTQRKVKLAPFRLEKQGL